MGNNSFLKDIVLLDFDRKKDGKIKTFIFKFSYKGKEYTLIHDSLYGNFIDHWFKIKKPLFSKNPFNLDQQQLLDLSNFLLNIHYKKSNLSS